MILRGDRDIGHAVTVEVASGHPVHLQWLLPGVQLHQLRITQPELVLQVVVQERGFELQQIAAAIAVEVGIEQARRVVPCVVPQRR